ncbi:retrovirus-related Pol polyprotein from transposon TNT 1-94 [Trichonephila clavipes]|nr:retrovirus-related Pol polyprotein from transposon TNT 1-94 [Trichonephila clavipes]
MIKNFTTKTIVILTYLTNKILFLRHFPNKWKITIIVPVKKLDTNIINPNQYGFTKHLSTCHPLLRLTENSTAGFQRGRSTGTVVLDIQKAFDRVWINSLELGEDVRIFISRVKTRATRLQEAGHKLDDLYIGFQLIRWSPQEFQSTMQQIYRWKEQDFRAIKIEAGISWRSKCKNVSARGLPRLTGNGKSHCIPCKLAKSKSVSFKKTGAAINSREASKWHDAMDKEINVMMERKVWDSVDPPDNIKILENRWVYTIKYGENNKIVRYKARLVTQGNTQLTDSDFATNRDNRVSMEGFITFIDDIPISWRTFKQKSVSLSTMEAGYVTLTEAANEFIWLKNIINNKSLNLELSENVMFCDNQEAISFSNSPVENYRTKHIDVRYHFLRNLMHDEGFQFKYIGTKNNLADIFTKPMVSYIINFMAADVPVPSRSDSVKLLVQNIEGYISLKFTDESNVEVVVLPPYASELTDEDEGDENEVITGEIIENDVPGGLGARTGDNFQPESSTSSSSSTTKSRKKAKRHESFGIKNKSPYYTKWKTQD